MTPIASQWILRRVTGNVSYQDMGRAPVIEWAQLAPGVHKMQGCSHAMIIVEMRDPFCRGRRAAVGGSRRAGGQVDQTAVSRKPIRYAIPTHHHLDHAGGIRAFMAESAA